MAEPAMTRPGHRGGKARPGARQLLRSGGILVCPYTKGTGPGASTLRDGQPVLVDGTRREVTAAAAEPPP